MKPYLLLRRERKVLLVAGLLILGISLFFGLVRAS